MKVCFNEATTMKKSTLEKDLEFCEKHGYEQIKIGKAKTEAIVGKYFDIE